MCSLLLCVGVYWITTYVHEHTQLNQVHWEPVGVMTFTNTRCILIFMHAAWKRVIGAFICVGRILARASSQWNSVLHMFFISSLFVVCNHTNTISLTNNYVHQKISLTVVSERYTLQYTIYSQCDVECSIRCASDHDIYVVHYSLCLCGILLKYPTMLASQML